MEMDLDHIFGYHAPDDSDRVAYEAIRAAGKAFAKVIVANTPASADQTAAIRKVREAVFTANAARALKGRVRGPHD
jgi:plasmid stabilization system protein ParE